MKPWGFRFRLVLGPVSLATFAVTLGAYLLLSGRELLAAVFLAAGILLFIGATRWSPR